jgi:hypothetical protein
LDTLKASGAFPALPKFPFGPAAWGHSLAKARPAGKSKNKIRLTPVELNPILAKRQPRNFIERKAGQKKPPCSNEQEGVINNINP